ncbi:universal stress protein [Aciduliprofundum sp. MAR08-339]|uniref:universal stress protein n=1 Tax=Aciduliprofundum sp. (strain MAR08-339) TaxID=673860 RepID=UPI0009FD0D8E
MIKKILIPTDGYGLEDHVIRYVARAFPFADFHVISVVNTYERGVQMTDILYREMKDSARKAIQHAEALLEEEGIHLIHTHILEGLPSREIVKYSKIHDLDIIAMRVYCRKSTASAHRMGSTIRNVLRISTIPVLTLAEECQRYEIKNILLLTDGTGISKRAENYAILLASSYKARLEALYIKEEDEDASKKLDSVMWRAKYLDVNVKRSIESFRDMLMKHFANNDLVVMGIGRRRILHRHIGHMAQIVATHSPIPVIFVSALKKRWFKRA